MEGNYSFEKWANENHLPFTYEELKQQMLDKSEKELDELWDHILDNYEAHEFLNSFIFMIPNDTDKAILEADLQRHGIDFFWEKNKLHVPYEKRLLVQDIIKGLFNRSVITSGNFVFGIKKR